MSFFFYFFFFIIVWCWCSFNFLCDDFLDLILLSPCDFLYHVFFIGFDIDLLAFIDCVIILFILFPYSVFLFLLSGVSFCLVCFFGFYNQYASLFLGEWSVIFRCYGLLMSICITSFSLLVCVNYTLTLLVILVFCFVVSCVFGDSFAWIYSCVLYMVVFSFDSSLHE